MLSFTHTKVNVDTLLANSNTLTKFNPSGTTNNALQITADGQIKVVSKEDTVEMLVELFGELSVANEAKRSFAAEKKILAWHFSQLLPYLQQRLTHLRTLPIDTLRQYHDNSMQLQGFYQLCNNITSQLAAFNQLVTQLENPHKNDWSTRFNLVQQGLSKQLEQVVDNALTFIQQVKKLRKEKLSVNRSLPQLHVVGPLMVIQSVDRAMPLEYSLGVIKISEQRYEAKAHFQTLRSTWDSAEKFQFTGNLKCKLFQGDTAIHAAVVLRPSWNFIAPTETTEDELNADSALETLRAQYLAHPVGAIRFEPCQLRAHFVELCTHVSADEILPYCATIIDIARSHQMQQITVFAPYQHSAIMMACGFRILKSDAHEPTTAQQSNQVEHAFAAGVETPILPRYRRQVAVNNVQKELLRPFSFYLDQIDTTPVYLTESRVKTTYAQLLQKSTITQHEDCEHGLLPEVLQIPLRFTGAFDALRAREISGRLKRPAVTYAVEPVNYQALDNDQRLQDYAFADPEAAKQSQHQKMLVLKRKMI